MLETFGFYDVFLSNAQGDAVYTVLKETDASREFRHARLLREIESFQAPAHRARKGRRRS